MYRIVQVQHIIIRWGIPCWSSGWDSALPLLGGREGGTGSIPGRGTGIPHAAWHSQ